MKQTKTAIVTGASSGLGYEFTKILASEGYDLVLVARSEGKLYLMKEKLEKPLGIKVYVCAKDLSKPDAAKEIWDYIKEQGLTIDVLINDAGFGDFGKFAQSDLDKQTAMVQVNIMALMQLTYLCLGQMRERKQGEILNLASIAAFAPGPMMSVYYASKAFVLSFTEALSVELKGSGVSVTALCPGPTNTGFAKNARLGTSKLFKVFEWTSAKSIAEYGYQAMKKKKVTAVAGKGTRLIALGIKIMPRRIVRWIIYLVQK